jgi:hypothetical protein
MFRQNPKDSIGKPDNFDILSAIWILSCNDENSLITYKGIVKRLNLAKNFDVEALVKSRPELFRLGGSEKRINEWKNQMRQGKSMPSWIRDISDGNERNQKIDAIVPSDVFRSQFRAKQDSPQSSLEIIEWGLSHIDRIRKARVDSREGTAKSWQGWLLIIIGLTNIGIAVFNATKPFSGKQP